MPGMSCNLLFSNLESVCGVWNHIKLTTEPFMAHFVSMPWIDCNWQPAQETSESRS